MRIWIGKEEEGYDKGLFTLFIEARFVCLKRAKIIKKLYEEYNPSYIYFGANKKNLIYISKRALKVLPKKLKLETSKKISIGVKETSFSQVIVRQDRKYIDNIVLKLESSQKIRIFCEYEENTKYGLKKGLYSNDKLLTKK